jgi:maltooligosyltrehalose trehalohydrolase
MISTGYPRSKLRSDNLEHFGAIPGPDGICRFVVWAPAVSELSLVACGRTRSVVPMERDRGSHVCEIEAAPGTRYLFRLPDGRELPDPASRFQPDGVHGVSAVVDTNAFRWTDAAFRARALSESIIYELHVGTFSETGTFAGAINHLDPLVDLGVTTVELMPVAQFPGSRNWGYDGVFPFAVQNSYGGPEGLQQFVDAAHARGLSVILDVVYNHLGPEGNYVGAFCPFFNGRYRTPWGQAVNFDDADSGPVRAFLIRNALYWLGEFHIDGLRLDAVHGIFDFSARHFLDELNENVAALAARTGRTLHVIAESDLNDARLLHKRDRGGYALDAQWSDDFHHSVHTLLTAESAGYYRDFGSIEDLRVTLEQGWRYAGQYSNYRRRRHGNSPAGLAPQKFVVCSQNHDQVGNRALGDRLSQIVDFESLKLAAGITLLSPFVPLLFMGEEYGETSPFLYFTSHQDAALVQAVRNGRREDFRSFGWSPEIPDPQDEQTFRRSRLNRGVCDSEPHRSLLNLYKTLIGMRNRFGIGCAKPLIRASEEKQMVALEYRGAPTALTAIFHFGNEPLQIPLELPGSVSRLLLNSSDKAWAENAGFDARRWSHAAFPFGRRSFVVFESRASGEKP